MAPQLGSQRRRLRVAVRRHGCSRVPRRLTYHTWHPDDPPTIRVGEGRGAARPGASSRHDALANPLPLLSFVCSAMAPGVFVTVTIPADKREEFLKTLETDCLDSRKEPGCQRFDLLD